MSQQNTLQSNPEEVQEEFSLFSRSFQDEHLAALQSLFERNTNNYNNYKQDDCLYPTVYKKKRQVILLL